MSDPDAPAVLQDTEFAARDRVRVRPGRAWAGHTGTVCEMPDAGALGSVVIELDDTGGSRHYAPGDLERLERRADAADAAGPYLLPGNYLRIWRNQLGEPSPDALDVLAEILAEHRHHVIVEVIREIRAEARALAERSGGRKAAKPLDELIGHLRKTFTVSAGMNPSMRKRRRFRISLRALFERDGGICRIGNHPITLAEATRDHIIPLARGGKNKTSNIQLACRPCNELKGELQEVAG